MNTILNHITIEKITKSMLFHGSEPFANSLEIAKHFKIRHNDLLRKIREFYSFDMLIKSRKITQLKRMYRGQEFPYFELDADAYSFICLSITGKKAEYFKWVFLEAFKKATADAISARVAVEHNRVNNEWLLARSAARDTRKALQDKIKEFSVYAEAERGESYGNHCPLYKHITDAVYSFVGVEAPKANKSRRDVYTGDIIEEIESAEEVVIEFLDEVMKSGGTRKGIKQQVLAHLKQRDAA